MFRNAPIAHPKQNNVARRFILDRLAPHERNKPSPKNFIALRL
jgi:hypothetical protein